MSDDERDRVRAHAREHYLPALRNDRHPNARTLLAVLLCLLRPDGTASLSYEFLAHVTGIPRGKVSVVLAELERRGMLERTPGRPSTGRGRPRNVYRVPTNIGHGPSVFSATATVAYNGEVRGPAHATKKVSDARARENTRARRAGNVHAAQRTLAAAPDSLEHLAAGNGRP